MNYSISEIDEISVIATEMMRHEVAAMGGVNPPDITPGMVRHVLKASKNMTIDALTPAKKKTDGQKLVEFCDRMMGV